MADATANSRPPRPLPSGWSDSSDDGNPGNGEAAGGGFDDSSSDGGWGGQGGGGGGGGMREFERSSAERTRRALLENDEKLCEPPKLPSRQQQQDDVGSLGGDSDGSQEGEGIKQQQAPSLRYVPGDPFANEEADVGAWAKHFTYLSVVPRKGAGGEGGAASPKIEGSSTKGGSMSSREQLVEESTTHGLWAPLDVMEMDKRSDERGAQEEDEETKRRSAQADEAAADAPSIGSAAAAAASRDPAADAERETPHGKQRHPGRPKDEAEEVFASHGVYEEYLAYDCRPPGGADEDSTDGGRTASAGEGRGGGAFVCSTAGAPDAVASAEHDGWMSDKPAPDTAAAAAAPQGPRPRRRLDTPQRELRQEIMDRLFDELWGRITPELLRLMQPAEMAGPGGRGGGGSAAGVGLGSNHEEVSPDSMED